jgi:hypothetical protein
VNWLRLEPAAIGSAVLALYAAVMMLLHVLVWHDGVLDTSVLIAAAGALWGLYTRARVTPTAAPKDDLGQPLIPVTTP